VISARVDVVLPTGQANFDGYWTESVEKES